MNANPEEYRPLGRESRPVLSPLGSWHIASLDWILHCNQTPPEWFALHLFLKKKKNKHKKNNNIRGYRK